VRVPVTTILGALADTASALSGEAGVEAGLNLIARTTIDLLGDGEAADRPDALKPGQRSYRVAGAFLITPDRRYNMLCGNVGFPREQRRLMIPIAWNHPGLVVADERALLVADTDADERFRQFLKTSRMGSSIYAPFFAGGRMIGQMVVAAQARWTFDASDLDALSAFAALAGLHWSRTGGDAFLALDYPAPDAWRAEDHVV
jgi:hypothetical protein